MKTFCFITLLCNNIPLIYPSFLNIIVFHLKPTPLSFPEYNPNILRKYNIHLIILLIYKLYNLKYIIFINSKYFFFINLKYIFFINSKYVFFINIKYILFIILKYVFFIKKKYVLFISLKYIMNISENISKTANFYIFL